MNLVMCVELLTSKAKESAFLFFSEVVLEDNPQPVISEIAN